MKIGIDISQIVYGTGVSVYTRNLVESLLKIDRENEYVLFGGGLRRKGELESFASSLKGNFSTKFFPIPPTFADLVWNKLHKIPIEKIIGQIDVLHTSDWTEPPSSAFKVTTVHDLYPLKFPKMVHPKVREAHKKRLSWVKAESKRIIVPSNSTKTDLVSLGFDPAIIRITPEAPSLKKASADEIKNVRKKYRINEDYLVSIGITPLKNTERIIKAFDLARSGQNIKLILIGKSTNIEINEQRNVRILGHVASSDLAPLISGSSALVFPSLYEGYGIPILDGFNCGVPVVTSNIASMPEVAGDAAALTNPYEIDSIKEGIEKVLRGPKGFIEKGYERVKEFSWEKTARMTLDVYNEAYGKR